MNRWLGARAQMDGHYAFEFFRHLNILSGSGVGGGSLVYACTLPIPKPAFFKTGGWAGLNDWENAAAVL